MELIAVTLRGIRKSRNNLVFWGEIPRAVTLIDEAEALLESYSRWSSKDRNLIKTKTRTPARWVPPKASELKLNVDASVGEAELEGAIAGVLGDSNGSLVDGFSTKIPSRAASLAEVRAPVEGLKMLEDKEEICKKRIRVTVESDSLDLVRAVNREMEASWEAKALIFQAQQILARLHHISVAHCKRTGNQVADWVSKTHR
ncbi:uncharacterized protein LOC115726385 [Rhodamnia argentea]|uniref:Uncharacterized protein LOC115726385 n=1 Tax=Rhodamnia argentea TaxID=178133 RepID=A0A8B8MQN1_9MYRT|nr:uncharacterized protein LOC115726385 [Rhodamnia argentea]